MCYYSVMQLADDIQNYYFEHLAQLDSDKQFHFCTRLAAWRGDNRAVAFLEQYRTQILPITATSTEMKHMLRGLMERHTTARANAANLRNVYFDAYPELRGICLALFRVRHLQAVYGIDTRTIFLDVMPESELLRIKQALLNDDDAMRILSTYAVNFLYLTERVILDHDSPKAIDLVHIYNLGKGYDKSNSEHLRLLIYLYTHCIIGESNFYTRAIPEYAIGVYRDMLASLEVLIAEHFDDISLDNKLEFLVCCRICSYDSPLFDRIYKECDKSLSPNGTYLIDTLNMYAASSAKKTFAASEHRNVLYILSTSAYDPANLSKLIQQTA